MFPMGGGVSKAGIPRAPQCHHWSAAEQHFWCCLGSGVEAFARLHALPFWAHGARALLVLQFVPAELRWAQAADDREGEADVDGSGGYGREARAPAASRTVTLEGGDVGATRAGDLVVVRLRVGALDAAVAPTGGGAARRAAPTRVHVRVPQWALAHTLRVEGDGAAPLGGAAPTGGGDGGGGGGGGGGGCGGVGFASVQLAARADAVADVRLELRAGLRAERARDDRALYAPLHALLYGPLVLAVLTARAALWPARSCGTDGARARAARQRARGRRGGRAARRGGLGVGAAAAGGRARRACEPARAHARGRERRRRWRRLPTSRRRRQAARPRAAAAAAAQPHARRRLGRGARGDVAHRARARTRARARGRARAPAGGRGARRRRARRSRAF
jgi:hypothetical protein